MLGMTSEDGLFDTRILQNTSVVLIRFQNSTTSEEKNLDCC